jgi:prevent-host-death family protein
MSVAATSGGRVLAGQAVDRIPSWPWRISDVTMGRDHGTICTMDTVPVSRFKATCLAALERVRQTGRPLLVTKRGVPLAQIFPPPLPPAVGTRYGVLAGSIKEHGDLLAPLDADEWEALR